MNEIINITAILVFSYLLGSIPTAYMIVKIWKRIDIRALGSGNPGATNVFRVAGIPAGIITLFIDIFKGFIAVWLTKTFLSQNINLHIISGLSVIAGHNWTFWLKFRGGKGVATSLGVMLALAPLPALCGVAAFIIVLLFTKFVSVSSMISAVLVSGVLWLQPGNPLVIKILISLLAVVIIIRHKSNISRLIKNEEHRLKI